MNHNSSSRQLLDAIWPGPLAAQAVYVVAKLNIADLIGKEAKSADDLAAETGTRADALGRALVVAKLNIAD